MRKLLPLLLILLLPLSGCSRSPITVHDFTLNTFVSVTVYRKADEAAAREALELCRSYEKVFSRTDPESELYRLNRREISQVSEELASVIETGLYYSQLSKGAFDITAGSITQLWDFTAQAPAVPDPAEIARQLPAVGWDGVSLTGNTVTFTHPETVIDLGGIAKGYIADRIAEQLRQSGVPSALIDLGGNLYCLGSKPEGGTYNVGIQFPFKERDQVLGIISASEQSVVTSGVYERCFTENDILYHHILDPQTGYPAKNELVSVTIVSGASVDGDALSTACFVLGLEEGIALIESLPDVEALFVTDDLQTHASSGMASLFRPIS